MFGDSGASGSEEANLPGDRAFTFLTTSTFAPNTDFKECHFSFPAFQGSTVLTDLLVQVMSYDKVVKWLCRRDSSL